MIRKILLLTAVVVVALWLTGAHLVKGNLILAIKDLSSDNIKFSYQDTKLSGFPFNWEVKFLSPKITIIDHKVLRELSTQEIKFKFNYLLQSVNLDLSKLIKYSETQGKFVKKYQFSSNQNMFVNMKFDESLYFLSTALQWKKFIASTEFNLPQLTGILDDREIFILSKIKVISKQERSDLFDKIRLKLFGNYNSSVSYLKVNKARLFVDLNYLINNSVFNDGKKSDFERKLEISRARLKFDNAALDFSGVLKLTSSSLPQGEIDVSMVQYHNVIDTLFPEDFIISGSHIKEIISKATLFDFNNSELNTNNVNLKIHFSNHGISVGKLNLFELKVE